MDAHELRQIRMALQNIAHSLQVIANNKGLMEKWLDYRDPEELPA